METLGRFGAQRALGSWFRVSDLGFGIWGQDLGYWVFGSFWVASGFRAQKGFRKSGLRLLVFGV